MAKAPMPGSVKTRLCPPLDPESAAQFHRCCVLDAVEKGHLLTQTQVVLAYTPTESLPIFEQMALDVGCYMGQEGRDLGERMLQCFRKLCKPGAAVVLAGTDTRRCP